MRVAFSSFFQPSTTSVSLALLLLSATASAWADDSSTQSRHSALARGLFLSSQSYSDSPELPSFTDRPEVHLDHLRFPKNIQDAPLFEKHLRRTLRREARRVDWGAGQNNRIEYRFDVTQLKFTFSDGALRIRCSATGSLPGGKTAKSDLSFGGLRSERNTLTKKVLDIVARGVVGRLAELERRRRGLR